MICKFWPIVLQPDDYCWTLWLWKMTKGFMRHVKGLKAPCCVPTPRLPRTYEHTQSLMELFQTLAGRLFSKQTAINKKIKSSFIQKLVLSGYNYLLLRISLRLVQWLYLRHRACQTGSYWAPEGKNKAAMACQSRRERHGNIFRKIHNTQTEIYALTSGRDI